MKRAAILCLLLATSIAAPGAQPASVGMAGYPRPGAAPILKLLSAGSGPRTALRFAIAPSHRAHADMGMQMSMEIAMGGTAMPGVSMPTMTVGCDLAVTNVAANGDITYTMAFTGVAIAPGADPRVTATLQGLSDAMKTVKGTATVSDRGVVRAIKLDQGSVDPQLSQLLGQLSNQAQSLSIPLPEEEIGAGARWEVRQALAVGGIQMFQRAEYELAAYDANTATLNVKLQQTAPAQSVANPALPPGTTVRLVTMAGSGSGTSTLRFDSLLPTSEVRSVSTTTMEITTGGNRQTMSTKASMTMTIAPGK